MLYSGHHCITLLYIHCITLYYTVQLCITLYNTVSQVDTREFIRLSELAGLELSPNLLEIILGKYYTVITIYYTAISPDSKILDQSLCSHCTGTDRDCAPLHYYTVLYWLLHYYTPS